MLEKQTALEKANGKMTLAFLAIMGAPLKPFEISQHYRVEGLKGGTSVMSRETSLLDSGCTFFQSVFFLLL